MKLIRSIEGAAAGMVVEAGSRTAIRSGKARRLSAEGLAAIALLCIVPLVDASEIKIEEQVVGPAWEQGTTYTLSAKGLHLATAGPKGSRFAVTIDGVEGPKFDEILRGAAGVTVSRDSDGNVQSVQVAWEGPVAFSPDGSRHAYAARAGEETVVILDGTEIFRGPYSAALRPTVSLLSFSPDGKHLFFHSPTDDTLQSYRLMVDGKPATSAFNGTPYPFFSGDGKRWVLVAGDPRDAAGSTLYIDGADAGYKCTRPAFSPDGQHVACTRRDAQGEALLVDGNPVATGNSIVSFRYAANGSLAAITTGTAGVRTLIVDGKPIEGSQGVQDFVFSPNGARWAARCANGTAWWMVVDGVKQQEYKMVHDATFTPDGSKLVYVAENGAKQFVVTNGEEDGGNRMVRLPFLVGTTGGHVAYSVYDGSNSAVVHDGKLLPAGRVLSSFVLSADGSRTAYYASIDAMSGRLVVDGEVRGGGTAYDDKIVFSPDSRHVVAMSSDTDGKRAIFLDSQFVPMPQGSDRYARFLGFTPDGQHLLVSANLHAKDGSYVTGYFLDGEAIPPLRDVSQGWNTKVPPNFWEMQDDGSVLLIGSEPVEYGGSGPMKYGPMKRVRLVPAPGTSVADWVTNAREAQAKAEAAEQQARNAALAARTKAADDRARERAAEQKARAEASAARAKAKAEASAARRSSRSR